MMKKTIVVCGCLLLLRVAWVFGSGQPAPPRQNTPPATAQPAYDPCAFVGTSFTGGDLIDINQAIEEEKKLPSRFTYLIGDESLADGLMALEQFADRGLTRDDFAINRLGRDLHSECQARVALQNRLDELQRQVSLLQKELHPKPAPKGGKP